MGKDLDFWKNRVAGLECKLSKAQVEKQEWHDEAVAIKKNRDEMLANFRKGIEPYVDLQDMHDKIAELESQNEELEKALGKATDKCAAVAPSREWLEDRHQQDCITINELTVALNKVIDMYSRLREQVGLK